MKLIRHSTSCLVHLLLLAELFVRCSSHPTGSRNLCGDLRRMSGHVDSLASLSKQLYSPDDKEVLMTHTLKSLPQIQHHAGYFNSVQMNESLSELLAYARSFRLHVEWLETAQDNMSLPSDAAQQAGAKLRHLSKLLDEALQQVNEDLPQPPSPSSSSSSSPSPSPPSLPVPSTAFDVFKYSVEISGRLRAFSRWTKRVLTHLERVSLRCPRH